MPRYVTAEGERGVDIARAVLGDARAAREIIGIADPFRRLEAGTVLFLPGGASPLDTPTGISLHSIPAVDREPPPSSLPYGGPSGTGPGVATAGLTQSPTEPPPTPTSTVPSGILGGAPSGPSGSSYGGPAAPSGIANLPGYAQDQIMNLVNVFDSLLGYPKSFDASAMAIAIMNQGLENQPEEAFAYMYSQLSADQQTHVPWAQFGLDEQTYHQEAARYQSMWFDLTGGAMPADLLKQSISQQWTVQQMMQGGQAAAASGKVNAPWLASGQTFTQVQENYFSAFGTMPSDTQTLTSWFQFRLGAAQTRTTAEGQVGLSQQAQTRLRDVETR
jgi:hypothetical protein